MPTSRGSGPHAGQRVLEAGASLGSGQAVVIMVHGRGGSADDILGLSTLLDRPDLTYLAPSAANNTWYPYSFMAERAKNEPWLSSALETLANLIADVEAAGVAREKIVLLGFSQGACLSSEFAVRHAARYGGVIAFSGGLIGEPGTTWNYAGSFDRMPAFFGCSDVDPHIPEARVHESFDVYRRMGAIVTERIYPDMAHTIVDDEIGCARLILDEAAGRPPADEDES